MNAQNAVRKLDELPGLDPGQEHAEADKILLALVPAGVRDAYRRMIERNGGIWFE